MSLRGRHALCGLCGLAAASLVPAPASAGNDDSNALFDAGVLQMEAGRYDEACPSIEHSYELDPRPGVLFTLAECQSKRGRIAAAVARYTEYLALFAALPPAKKKLQTSRPKAARAQLALLSPQVPKLVVTLAPGAPPGVVVERDGHVLAEATLGTSLPVDPGDHVLRVSVPGGALGETHVKLERGEQKSVMLALPALPPRPTAEEPERRGPSARRVAAFVTGGVGLAGLVLGGAMGGVALARKSVVDAHCNVGGVAEACDHDGKAAADQLGTFALASTVGFVAGGALVVASVVLFATEPAPPKPASSGASATARRLELGVAPARGAGASFLLRGAW
jgi:tetratricopeptide (TPR) repeat protein